MRCVSVDIKACAVVGSGKHYDIWHMLRDTYVLNSSLSLLLTIILRYMIICMSTISPIVRIEFLPACGPKNCRLVISSRLEEHRACYRKTMLIAE